MREQAVLVLLLGVVGVGGRVQAAHARVVGAEREQGAQLAEQLADQLALAVVELEHVAALAQHDAAAGVRSRHQSCRMVAHRPCSWSRKTSSSAFSRVPLETTARPLWWTSSISSVAFARL